MINKIDPIDMTNMIEAIRNRAKACRARVGVGIADDTASEAVISDIESACEFADVVLIGDEKELSATGTDLEIIHSDQPEVELVDRLVDGRIDAAVRGTLGATKTLGYLKSALGVSRLDRLALLTTADSVPFFLVPVGIDEGNSVADRVDLVSKSVNAIRRFGITEKVAVLSGGRFEDAGRSEIVDQSLADGEVVTERLCELGIDAKHYGILIEDAIGVHADISWRRRRIWRACACGSGLCGHVTGEGQVLGRNHACKRAYLGCGCGCGVAIVVVAETLSGNGVWDSEIPASPKSLSSL